LFDQHFTDGEHVFHVVSHCSDGSKGFSETATVIADRGVPVAIQAVDIEYSQGVVVLRWSVADGGALGGFNIYRSAHKEAGFERINAQLIAADSGNRYTDADVSPGTTYWYRLGAVDGQGEWMSHTVSISVPSVSLKLNQNVPNPFNPTTLISFAVPSRSTVTLRVYDVQGRHVKTLLDDVVDAGVKNVVWDGTDERGNRVGSGVYFYQLKTANKLLTKRMVRLK
jgi:fibronectin type 3 domain-containing protein